MVNLDTLEKVEVFHGLDDRRLAAVGECCTEAVFQRGEAIFKAGEAARYLWAVAEGKVELKAEPGAILQETEVSESRVFGWPSLVRTRTYRFSAFCAGRSARMIQISGTRLQELFEKDPELGYRVMSGLLLVIGSRFHQLQEEVVKCRGREIMDQW